MATRESTSTGKKPTMAPTIAQGLPDDDPLTVVRDEILNLYRWLHLVECSQCEFEIDPRELAEMVGQRLQVVKQFCDLSIEAATA